MSCEAHAWDDAGPELTGWLLDRLPYLADGCSRRHNGPLIVVSDHLYPEFDLTPAVVHRLNLCHDKSVTIHHEEMGKYITLWYDVPRSSL